MFFSNLDFNLQPIVLFNNEIYFIKEEYILEEKEELLNYIQKSKKI